VSKVIYFDLLFKMNVCLLCCGNVNIIVLASVNGDRNCVQRRQPTRKIILRQLREVLNLFMAVKTFVALLRRPSGSS